LFQGHSSCPVWVRDCNFHASGRKKAAAMSSHLALLILTLFIHQTLQSIPPSSGASGENGFSTSESFGGSESSFRYAPLIAEAVESGIQEAKELFETIEPNLYAKSN